MKWVKDQSQISKTAKVPIKSWCEDLEDEALNQAKNLACHPVVERHVALMPDAHVGYGMPIGGVIACNAAVIPNAVGVDIGCGMGAVQTNVQRTRLKDMKAIRAIMDAVKTLVPVGEGNSHRGAQCWDGFDAYLDSVSGSEPAWLEKKGFELDRKNLGTLGGGNHFIEIQQADDAGIWLMLHSGSRNLGYRIAAFYHRQAQQLNKKWHADVPHKDLAFLPTDEAQGQAYVRDMTFALEYARENRRRMMAAFKIVMADVFPDVAFTQEINIHHNYANLENHFINYISVHRKGATSAKKDEMGIIPGSMGTPSYIVRGLGNPESFMSCSHGAGRKMGRKEASRILSLEECDQAMAGVVFDRWKKTQGKFGRKKTKDSATFDFGEAPLAYKDIDQVIQAQTDLVEAVVKLRPLGVIKG